MRDDVNGELPAGFEPVREFVRVAEAKLGQLQTRKEHIRSRMQALRYLAKHAEGRRPHRMANPSSASCQFSPGNAAPEATEQAKLQSPTFHNPEKLRRACRIALLESDTPQSCAEVYQRIRKRGSLSFDGYDNVLQLLADQLNSMSENSEILSFTMNGEIRWQWKY